MINNNYLESVRKQILYYKSIADKFSKEKSIKNFTDDELKKLK
jgi:hypothetical protein